MYSVADFGAMIGDGVRMAAYRQALSSSVRPDSVVLDIGTGTGVMAMLALRYGARRVYAIEPSDIIQIARETAAANGMQDRIVFIQDLSSKVTLPERVDLMVEDLRGALPWYGTHLLDVIDARRRFLKPGGQIISARDTVYCAVVQADEQHRTSLAPWQTSPDGLDLTAANRYVANSYISHVAMTEILTPGAAWTTIDYATVASPQARGHADLRVTGEGTAHGLLLWSDGELVPGVNISSAPGMPDTVYGRRFYPWPQPVLLRKGARVAIELRADLVGGDYVWTWETGIHFDEAPKPADLRFRQSTFLGAPVTRETLSRRASGHRPRLNQDGRAVHFVLAQMQGAMPLRDIAARLAIEHADRFRTAREALDYVARLSGSYSE